MSPVVVRTSRCGGLAPGPRAGPYSPRELTIGGYVATALWVFAFGVAASLALWSTQPYWS